MSILKVARLGHPILRAKTRKLDRREIRSPRIQSLVDDMMISMREYGGIGLAAPQIHEALRLFVAVIATGSGDADAVALFNAQLSVVGSEIVEDWEGCLSLPGVQGVVPRARVIDVEALDRNGDRMRFQAADLSARVIQHESDHVDGVLFIDRLTDRRSLAYVDQSAHVAPTF
jgi:peptide deformylase